MSKNLSLFEDEVPPPAKPLAEELRPAGWKEFEGLGELDQHLVQQLSTGQGVPPSLILWGPPGCGKTTFAKLVGHSFNCAFIEFSAVLGGVKEVREIVATARHTQKRTILFVDEIHRFNKAQQDAFLPHIESGTLILIGATTENPSFYLTNALLSRVRVIVFPALSSPALKNIAQRGFGRLGLQSEPAAVDVLCHLCSGDGRRLLNMLEAFYFSALGGKGRSSPITAEELKAFFAEGGNVYYDRSGEEHYNIVSAFIKSLRGSNPDAALFWGLRMIEGGEDPRFLIRRMIIFASEDIGNADPRALELAVATLQAYEAIGLPEGKIPLAQCITYLASAPKSNRSYEALNAALEMLREHPRAEVPLHLRNAPTKLMKELGYGDEYRYPHSSEEGYAAGVHYLPKEVRGARFYQPTDRGYEKMIGERLAYWRGLEKEKSLKK